jgi:hypothetical protein
MTKINRRLVLGAVLCAALLVTVVGRLAVAEDKFIIVQSTTSTQNSGLFEHILPLWLILARMARPTSRATRSVVSSCSSPTPDPKADNGGHQRRD